MERDREEVREEERKRDRETEERQDNAYLSHYGKPFLFLGSMNIKIKNSSRNVM